MASFKAPASKPALLRDRGHRRHPQHKRSSNRGHHTPVCQSLHIAALDHDRRNRLRAIRSLRCAIERPDEYRVAFRPHQLQRKPAIGIRRARLDGHAGRLLPACIGDIEMRPIGRPDSERISEPPAARAQPASFVPQNLQRLLAQRAETGQPTRCNRQHRRARDRRASIGSESGPVRASSRRFRTTHANAPASKPPISPATVPITRNSIEKICAIRLRVAPRVFRITTSRIRRKRVPATLDAKMIAPARIENAEMKRTTSEI